MRRAESLRRGAAALCAGALAGSVMLAAWTSTRWPVGDADAAGFAFDGARFVDVLPVLGAALCVLFLVVGPLVQRLRRAAGLEHGWGAALAGALVGFALLHAVEPSLRADPHLSHTIIAAAAAAVAHAWHARRGGPAAGA